MDTGKLAFFDETVSDDVVQEPVAPVELPATGEIEVVPPAAARELPTVPLTAVLDEREKRQAAQREADELRRELQSYKNPPQELVDILEDPEARLAHERSVFQQELINTKLDTSRFMAVEKYGEDLVNEAYAFFDAPENRHKTNELISKPSPFHAAVQAYQQHKAVTEVGTDPVAYRGKIEAEIRAQILAEMQQQPVQAAKPRPPVSLSSAPSAGAASNNAPLSKGSAFDAAFGG